MAMTTAEPRDAVRAGIVEAAARLLAAHGAQAVTTRAVAQAAGVQAPTLYRLFGDKDGLIEAVAEHVMATYVAAKANRADSAEDPLADLRTGWHMHVEFGLANPELYALLAAHGRRGNSSATQSGIAVLRGRVRRLAAAGLLRVDEERALMMIHAAGNGTVLALLGTPPESRDNGLVDAMLDAVLSSILDTTSPIPDTGTVTVAVAFSTVLSDLPGLTEAERTLMAEWVQRSLQCARRTEDAPAAASSPPVADRATAELTSG